MNNDLSLSTLCTQCFAEKQAPLRLWDTGCMGAWRRAQNRLKIYCEQLAKNCSTVYYFLVWFRSSQARFHSDLGNKVISSTFSREWRELFAISFVVSKILRFKHAGLRFQRWDRDIFPLLSTTRMSIQKSSLQSLGDVYVVSILQKQVLRIHTTLKSVQRKFEQYTGSISALA